MKFCWATQDYIWYAVLQYPTIMSWEELKTLLRDSNWEFGAGQIMIVYLLSASRTHLDQARVLRWWHRHLSIVARLTCYKGLQSEAGRSLMSTMHFILPLSRRSVEGYHLPHSPCRWSLWQMQDRPSWDGLPELSRMELPAASSGPGWTCWEKHS